MKEAETLNMTQDEIDQILEEFRCLVAVDSSKARALIKKLDYKNEPCLLQRIAQTYLDESRFHDDGTPRVLIEWRKWRMAERYAISAFELNSNCLIILSTMGAIRVTSGNIDVAKYCFEKIIKLGLKGVKSDKCDLDKNFALELINDSKFELYRLYYPDDPKLSEKYLKMYKKGLEKGINTIYKPLDKFLLQ